MTNTEVLLGQTLDRIQHLKNSKEKKDALISSLKELPKVLSSLPAYEMGLQFISKLEHPEEMRTALIEFMDEIPKTVDFLDFSIKALGYTIEAFNKIDDAKHRKSALLRIANKLPKSPEYTRLYKKAMELAIEASHAIEDRVISRYSLVDIAEELPKTREFVPLYLHAMRMALDLAEDPAYRKYSLTEIAKELPKSSDYAFYRKYTLLGMASDLLRLPEGLPLYKEAINFAIEAAGIIEEPYYKKYALMFIANELPKTPEFYNIYKQAVEESYKAALLIKDPFGKKHALIDIMKTLPKTQDFMPLFLSAIEQVLSFFTVKKWIDDIKVTDVLDFMLLAENRSMTDEKKHKFAKEKYANIFAAELDKLVNEVNDIRLIDILKPYSHVWIQPKALRDAAQKVVNRLENLKDRYHGRDIERPVFIKESHPDTDKQLFQEKSKAVSKDSLSIDLGATNTVIMRKKGNTQPDFLVLDALSRRYGDTCMVPTILNPETMTIGTAALGKGLVTDIKRMLIGNKPKGKEYMEQYIQLLYKHLKRAMGNTGWISGLTGSFADTLFLTVPIGFKHYQKTLREIIEKNIRGIRLEFIEEPLAAAIGYQVAESRDKVVMVIDFGGCTLDVMILRTNLNEVHVVAKPERSLLLGGKDIDSWLAEYLADKAGLASNERPELLLLKAEEIKISLSEHRVASFEWEGKEICSLTRETFEEILAAHDFYATVDRSLSYVLRKAEKVGVSKNMIEDVLITGGSSQIPSFKEKIGHAFSELRERNAIYDHSPLSAVARGAAMYTTRNIIDRHLGLAYAIRYTTKDKEASHSYDIILEKGEALPFEKTFSIMPAKALGPQTEIYLELAEVPEGLITRRWVTEAGVEYLRQAIKQSNDTLLKGLKIVTLPFDHPLEEDVMVTFGIDVSGNLKVIYGKENKEIDTGLRLQ